MTEWMQVFGSSHVAGIKYDESSQDCFVRFGNGDVYLYKNVSPEEWRDFVHADSKGRYIHRALRGSHAYSKVTDGEA
jgi:hypothetical protein